MIDSEARIRAADPAALKSVCLSSPVIRAGCEFRYAPRRNEDKNHSETTRNERIDERIYLCAASGSQIVKIHKNVCR